MTSPADSAPFGRKIRVGLLLNSTSVSAWEYEYLKAIVESEYAELTLLVMNSPITGRPSKPRRVWAQRNYWLYHFYSWFDRKLFPCRPDAFATRDATELFAGVPTLTVDPRRTQHCDYFEDADLQKIAEQPVDLFLRMGFRILRGGILTAAPLGIWSYHHADNRVNRGAPPGLWETLLGEHLTGSMLQLLSEDLDSGQVLCRSWSATALTSFWRNRHRYYWKSLEMIPRQLERLHRLGKEAFLEQAQHENPPLNVYDRPLYKPPTNWQLTRKLMGRLAQIGATQVGRLWHKSQWCLMLRRTGPANLDLRKFRRIVPPRDRFWADPFVVARNGRHYIFVEELVTREKRGNISVLEIDEQGTVLPARRVLDRPYHLSYPFMFRWQGEDYMIPESSENRTVDVYRCRKFPDEWELHKTLMSDVHACDATLLEHAGRWWMFVNIVSQQGMSSNDELFLFHADTPLSDTWTPHPLNPIVSDASRARPAGKIFQLGERLVRPAQICAPRYGNGIRFQEILELSETTYRERTLEKIEPLWAADVNGIHTINHEGEYCIADARQLRRRLIDLVTPDRPTVTAAPYNSRSSHT